MAVLSRYPDRLVSILLYAFVAIATILIGERILNRSIESKFYTEFLSKWEVSLQSYEITGGRWPTFTGTNHVEYMDRLTSSMNLGNIRPPEGRGNKQYLYKISKMGKDSENIFLLAFPNRLVIYGMSEDTFDRVDSLIDGMSDKNRGKMRGCLGKDRRNYIANWTL